jgi:predicted DNA-binding transcriptional regulator YafY
MDRKWVTHRLRPVSLMFTDYYFYLIAFLPEDKREKPYYFRVDRIRQITVHRKRFSVEDTPGFDKVLLRQRSLFMWPGKLQTIRFEFTGPSVQAVLDKLPTAKIIEREGHKCLIEAEVYGNGIKMWLLSQGTWIKVLSPMELVKEIKADISMLNAIYSK